MKFFSRLFLTSKAKLVIPIVGVLTLSILSSFILYEAMQVQVVFAKDGENEVVKTHAKTVGDLLDEVGVAVGEHDALSYDKSTPIESGMEIELTKSKKIYVSINDIEEEFNTVASTVGEFLDNQELTLSKHDEISHDSTEEIEDGLHILIKEAYSIKIDDAGEKTKVWTTGESVAELLDKNDIKLKKLDKVKPAIDKKVKQNTKIAITRVAKESEIIEESVAFETEKKEDNSLAKGKEKVVSEGKSGKVIKEFEITLENGKEVDRKLVDEDIKEKAENRIVALGTKEPKQEPKLVTLSSKTSKSPSTKSSSDKQPSGGKTFEMSATAYSIDCSGCDGRGITATGIDLRTTPKVVAVDPNVIPLGSKVWVEGYGNAIAGDTGGAIKGNRIDVHVSSRSEALNFGRKTVQVKVLD